MLAYLRDGSTQTVVRVATLTEIEVAAQTFYLILSVPSVDPITLGAPVK